MGETCYKITHPFWKSKYYQNKEIKTFFDIFIKSFLNLLKCTTTEQYRCRSVCRKPQLPNNPGSLDYSYCTVKGNVQTYPEYRQKIPKRQQWVWWFKIQIHVLNVNTWSRVDIHTQWSETNKKKITHKNWKWLKQDVTQKLKHQQYELPKKWEWHQVLRKDGHVLLRQRHPPFCK